MLGILNYKPDFFDNPEAFIKMFGDRLYKLIGRTFEGYWLMWETNEDKWYNDGPVILKIDNRQFEFTAYSIDKFSLTIDDIDLSKPLDWYGVGNQIPLAWKTGGKPGLDKLISRKITAIHVISYNFISTVVDDKENPENIGQQRETGFMLHGIEFTFEKSDPADNNNYLQIFNALDANGIKTHRVSADKQFQRINITTGQLGP